MGTKKLSKQDAALQRHLNIMRIHRVHEGVQSATRIVYIKDLSDALISPVTDYIEYIDFRIESLGVFRAFPIGEKDVVAMRQMSRE